MEFDHKNASYMDSIDNGPFTYMDPGLEYLQTYPPSPSFGVIGLSNPSSSPISFNNLNLTSTIGDYTYSSPSFRVGSPPRPYTPPDGASISPGTLTYNLSAGEMSSDTVASTGGRASRSGTRSPPASIPYAATVPRSHRFNPIAVPATRAGRVTHRRRSSRSNDDTDDEEDDEFQPANTPAGSTDSRRETIRKQRIESEQRRRDELRDGYAKLKDTLPPSTHKSSKVSLLERATIHLRYLESTREKLESRAQAAEAEIHRLRNVNEALMLSTTRHAVVANAHAGSSF